MVIPIIVYNGKTPFDFINSIESLFPIIEETREFVQYFRKIVLDLTVLEPETIEEGSPSAGYCGGPCKLKMLLLALKYSRSLEVLSVLRKIIRISEEAQRIRKWECDYLEVVLLYLGTMVDESMDNQFRRIIAEEHSGGEKYMGTIADKLNRQERLKREKIEEELRKKDIELERKDTQLDKKEAELEKKDKQLYLIIQKMSEKGLDPQLIGEITGLNTEKIGRILRNHHSR